MSSGWLAGSLPVVLAAFTAGSLLGALVLRRLVCWVRRVAPGWLLGVSGLAIVALSILVASAVQDTIDGMGYRPPNRPVSNFPEPRAAGTAAFTDDGRPISLFTRDPGELPADQLAVRERHETRSYELAHLRTGPADPSHNCHGWVFTGGRFWVRGDAVDSILSDNGYYEVSDPRVGDLIVYRRDEGTVSHTGLVRLTLEGSIIIESKWGPLGRFLHSPDDQPYGGRWTFHRSERSGHLIRFGPYEPTVEVVP